MKTMTHGERFCPPASKDIQFSGSGTRLPWAAVSVIPWRP
jgi:hypothetical protein